MSRIAMHTFVLLVTVYSAAIQEASNVLYDGLIEELVEVLNVRDPTLTVIRFR
jgi:hypothetical protein